MRLVGVRRGFLSAICLVRGGSGQFTTTSRRVYRLHVKVRRSLVGIYSGSSGVYHVGNGLYLLSRLEGSSIATIQLGATYVSRNGYLIRPYRVYVGSISYGTKYVFCGEGLLAYRHVGRYKFACVEPTRCHCCQFTRVSISFLSFCNLILQSSDLPNRRPIRLPLRLPSWRPI